MNIRNLGLILLVTSVLLFSAGCVGEELTAEQIAEEYAQKQAEIEDYSATIHMTMYMGDEEIKTVSTVAQKMPDKYKMVTTESAYGEGMTVVSNGETMWTYEPTYNSVMVMDMGSMMDDFNSSQMDYSGILQDLMDENDFTFDGLATVDGRTTYQISITPTNDSALGLLANINAWIDSETWMPLKLEMYDDEGTLMIVIEYKDFEVNTGIPDSEFEFEIPEDAEVVNFDDFEDLIPEQLTLEEAQELSENELLLPSYLPDGYEFESAIVNNNSKFFGGPEETVSITYSEGSGTIQISESFYESEPPAMMTGIGETVDINGHEGQLISAAFDGEASSLSWDVGNVRMSMFGTTVDADELIKIAESME